MHQGKTTTSAALNGDIDSNSSITPLLGGWQGGDLGTAFLAAYKQHTNVHTSGLQCPSTGTGGQGGLSSFPRALQSGPGQFWVHCASSFSLHGRAIASSPAQGGFGNAAKSSGADAQGYQTPAVTAAPHRDAAMRSLWVFWAAPGRPAVQELPPPR